MSSKSSSSNESHVVTVTDKLTEKLQNVTKQSYTPCIYEIPKNLRAVNTEAYTPSRVAIGPYNANYEKNPALKPMQQYKELYFSALISRNRNNLLLKNYVAAISSDDIQSARQCYPRLEIPFDNDETFTEMLLIDGAFIVEFFCKVIEDELTTSGAEESPTTLRAFFMRVRNDHVNDPIATNIRTQFEICRDLILLENQVPFFILERLYELTFESKTHSYPTLGEIAYCTLKVLVPFKWTDLMGIEDLSSRCPRSNSQVKHLVHLMWLCCLPFPQQNNGLTTTKTSRARKFLPSRICNIEDGKVSVCCLDVRLSCCLRKKKEDYGEPMTATQLQEAGMHFKKTKFKKPLISDISFANGVLKIPHLQLDESTETFFRNLMAFEQYYLNKHHITNYIYFMDALIDTTEDVEILEKYDVIQNLLESKGDVTRLFNSISRQTATEGTDFTDISEEIMIYATRPWNRWKAMLRRDYFGTPWAVISVFAAVVLLGLTIVQTIASVKQVKW